MIKTLFRAMTLISFAAFLLLRPAVTNTVRADPPDPNIGVAGFFSADKAQRGRVVQAAVVLDIPGGYHVNSNRPLGKYAIPTVVKVEGPSGARIGAISYPRATVRRLKASNNEALALFEGRAVMRFSMTLPANFQPGMTELRVSVRYQACNDEVCFPPQTRQISMPIGVVGASDAVKRINGNIFGRR